MGVGTPVRVILAVGSLLLISGCGGSDARHAQAAQLAQQKGCVACHGSDGVATAPAFPNLSLQWSRYLNLQLRAYRSGKRENAIMGIQAAGLSDDEIRLLSDFYGRKP